MPKVLLVEDDKVLANNVTQWLEFEHYVVEGVTDGEDALDRLRYYNYDVVILDWGIPKLAGIEVLRSYRAGGGTTPVLMLTGKDTIVDKELGLDSGADDYLTKPFHVKELSARIRALLRRPQPMTGNSLTFNDLELDTLNHTVKKGNKDIRLLPKEFSLLEFFIRHPNQVFSAENIIDRVWNADSEVSPESVRTYVTRLRSKIDVKGQDSIIETVHGVGYKLGPKK